MTKPNQDAMQILVGKFVEELTTLARSLARDSLLKVLSENRAKTTAKPATKPTVSIAEKKPAKTKSNKKPKSAAKKPKKKAPSSSPSATKKPKKPSSKKKATSTPVEHEIDFDVPMEVVTEREDEPSFHERAIENN